MLSKVYYKKNSLAEMDLVCCSSDTHTHIDTHGAKVVPSVSTLEDEELLGMDY